jgi:hypothetical protein
MILRLLAGLTAAFLMSLAAYGKIMSPAHGLTTSSGAACFASASCARCIPTSHATFPRKAIGCGRDVALKAFVDQWLHIFTEDGSFNKIYGVWFD